MAAKGRRQRARGSVVELPSGSIRVIVYADIDPLTGQRHCLDEVISAEPSAAAEAERVRTRFLSEVDESRNPKPGPR